MASAGELLREERLKQHRSLDDISRVTRISIRHLEAIEADNLKALPGSFFCRSFLKQYAGALEMDGTTAERVLATVAVSPEPDPIPALQAAYTVAKDDAKRSRFERPSIPAILSLFVAVLLGCSGLYALWNRSQGQKQAVAAAPILEKQSPPAVRQIPVPQLSDAQAQQASTVEVPPKTASPVEPAEAPAAPARNVQLAANERTWVSFSSEGKTLYAGIFDNTEWQSFPIGENARLLTANAGALEVRWNGKDIGPLGPRGRTRIVVFSADTFEIQAPAKAITARTSATRKATRGR